MGWLVSAFRHDPNACKQLLWTADDGALEIVGIYVAAYPELDDGDAAVDAGLPAVAILESFESQVGHEQYNLARSLAADLKTDRQRHGPVVLNGLVVDQQ